MTTNPQFEKAVADLVAGGAKVEFQGDRQAVLRRRLPLKVWHHVAFAAALAVMAVAQAPTGAILVIVVWALAAAANRERVTVSVDDNGLVHTSTKPR